MKLNPFSAATFNSRKFDSASHILGCVAKKSIALMLLLSLLAPMIAAAPDAPRHVLVSLGELHTDVRYAFARGEFLSGLVSFDIVKSLLGGNKKKQQPVDRVAILPAGPDGNLTVLRGETVDFSAVAYHNGEPVGGKLFEWGLVDVTKEGRSRKISGGTFKANRQGTFRITAATEGVQASVVVTVMPNEGYGIQRLLKKPESERTERERETVRNFRTRGALTSREIDTRSEYDAEIEADLHRQDLEKRALIQARQDARRSQTSQLNEQTGTPAPSGGAEAALAPVAQAELPARRKGGPSDEERPEDSIAKNPVRQSAPVMRRPADDDGWGGDDWWTADDPGNAVGSPAGSAPDAGAGNGNFRFATPVLSLGGRGIDANLSLVYNSRLWNKSGTAMKFDSDKGFPAPGWSIGFGKMIHMGANGGCMIATADGTRRSHTGTNNTYSSGTYYSHSYTGKTSDGSFIDYSCGYTSSTNGKTLSGYASLANGTRITYGSPSASYDQVYPTKITDAQGNYILITYKNNQGPRIDTITDTLARPISFHYDSNSNLISIEGPGYDDTTRTYVRLHYKQLPLTVASAFASTLTTDVPVYTPANNPWVIDAIYYPGTNLGYWFGEADSYSSYGMIAKIRSERGMGWTEGTPGTQGDIVRGGTGHLTYRTEEYTFPMTANSTLTDAPTYDKYKESWDRMDVTGPVETQYSKTTSSGNETITITRPDESVEMQTSDSNGYWFQNEIYSGSTLLSKTKTYFAAGAYGSTRPTSIEVTDSLQQTTKTTFSYGTSYNQLTSQKEYDYGNVLYRETKYTYENNAAYTGRHIFNLVKSVELVDASNNRLSRTDYQYDNNAVVNGTGSHGLVAAPGVVMHEESSDPHTTATQWVDGEYCLNYQFNYPECTYDGEELGWWFDGNWNVYGVCQGDCLEYEQVETSAYEPSTVFRGNVTRTTGYADAASLGTPIVHDYTYDITGNQRTATTNCCEQMTFEYTDQFSDEISRNTYAYPTSVTKGSPDTNSTQLRMTQSVEYDFNTGVVASSKDFNEQTTNYAYDEVARPVTVTAPTQAKTITDYGDDDFVVTKTVQKSAFDSPANEIVSKTFTELNGRGQPVVSGYFTDGTNSNNTAIEYDEMGRRKKVSMPYASAGGPQHWTVYTYDHLARVTQTTAPDNVSTSNTVFNQTGRPDSATNSPGQTVLSRDAWGRERWARTDAFGRLVEVVEPNPAGPGTTAPVNVAASANGATATASSLFNATTFPAAAVINGDRKGQGYGSGGVWADSTQNSYPDWVQVDFGGTKSIGEIDVFTVQDSYQNPSVPTETMTFSLYGIRDFQVQYWTGSAWATVPGGSVTFNNKVWRKFTFTPISTSKIRVLVSAGLGAGHSRIAEVEAWTPAASSNATGSVFDPGSMRTEYAYDRLDQLTQITQGDQTRKFKYDSLGRLTRQKLAEQTATINDAGQYVGPSGTGATWSDAFSYDGRSNLVQRTDARGVKTNFSYTLPGGGGSDPLNRLQGITYDKTGAATAPAIHEAPDVSIGYMATGDKSRVETVTTDGVSVETNAYDTFGRVTDYTVTMNGRSAYPFVTSYQYDTAGRLKEIRYPAQYGMPGNPPPRKEITTSFDEASQLTELKVDAATQLDQIVYNAAGQVTSLRTAGETANPNAEEYSFDQPTGLLTRQKVIRTETATNTTTTLLDLGYEYNRGSSVGSTSSGKTGQMTRIVDHEDSNRDRVYEHDALGRLIKAKGGTATGITGPTADWTQDYTYDRYGNKTGTGAAGITADSNAVPLDGLPSLSYNTANNRINATGWEYDLAGNQTRGQNDNGVWLRFEYDEAGRLVKTKDEVGNPIETYTYGVSRNRLITETTGGKVYYAWGGNTPIVEYTEATSSSTPVWDKSYVYAGSRLLSTATKDGSGEKIEFHHPDRLGTTLVTDPSAGTSFRQSTLPFGKALNAESTDYSNQVFTSYDRSSLTDIDYAVNRTYSPGQSRFTQVDPLGIGAASLGTPQSNNLFTYVGNAPLDFVDPTGLLRIQQCTRNWWINGGQIRYSSWQCTTIYDDGGDPGNGTPETGNESQTQNAIPKDCEDLLRQLQILDEVKKILKDGPFIDIDSIADEPAANYIKDYRGSKPVGIWFSDLPENGARTLRGDNSVTGIYYRSSELGKDMVNNPQLKLHEAVHLAFPKTLQGTGQPLDELLARRIGLTPKSGENFSSAVSRFFKSNCNPKEL